MSPRQAPDIATLAALLAERLPDDDLEQLAAAVRDGVPGIQQVKAAASSTAVRSACDDLHAALKHGSDGTFVAGCLLGARRAVDRARHQMSVDVVWTGPPSDVRTSRLTSSVVVHLIDEAEEELLLVSYATHPPAGLTAALERAISRGVQVAVLLERQQDNAHFTGGSAAFEQLTLRQLAWPAANRPTGASLHAKILVIDRRTALIGSANLTGHGLERNLECGVWLRSAHHARAIAEHITSLHERGDLRRV